MKTFFTLLLIIFNISGIYAQDSKIHYQAFGMDSIESGHLQNMRFERFQQHIQLSDDCLLSLPKGESILKMSDHFVITTQFIYHNPYQQKLSYFSIENCELKLISSSIFPYESEFYVSEKGEVIRSDFWEGYGKKLQILDQNLEVKAMLEPFEGGFNELSVIEQGEFWKVTLSPNKADSENILFKIHKTSHSISKL